jgi:hypothetical protein
MGKWTTRNVVERLCLVLDAAAARKRQNIGWLKIILLIDSSGISVDIRVLSFVLT